MPNPHKPKKIYATSTLYNYLSLKRRLERRLKENLSEEELARVSEQFRRCQEVLDTCPGFEEGPVPTATVKQEQQQTTEERLKNLRQQLERKYEGEKP